MSPWAERLYIKNRAALPIMTGYMLPVAAGLQFHILPQLAVIALAVALGRAVFLWLES